ncbi:type 4 pilus major pilin [Marinobacterium jannaschii]|uniref:type 4 pilus major pilin n=1 Tax=Marinobacterium jannaschii TaxID=64970 RepID=UPI00048177E8|nr:type 4 pilus major pilin [Marinobacterium jannaschii]
MKKNTMVVEMKDGKGFKKTVKKQKGYGLMEIMLGVAIVGVLGAAILPKGLQLKHDSEAKDNAGLVLQMFESLEVRWPDGPYAGLDNDWAIAAGLVPTAYVNGTNIENSYGFLPAFTGTTLTGGATNAAKQLTWPVAPEGCLVFTQQVSEGIDQITVGTTVVKTPTTSLDVAGATTACNVGTQSINVIMATR